MHRTPRAVEAIAGAFKIVDASKQSIAYVMATPIRALLESPTG